MCTNRCMPGWSRYVFIRANFDLIGSRYTIWNQVYYGEITTRASLSRRDHYPRHRRTVESSRARSDLPRREKIFGVEARNSGNFAAHAFAAASRIARRGDCRAHCVPGHAASGGLFGDTVRGVIAAAAGVDVPLGQIARRGDGDEETPGVGRRGPAKSFLNWSAENAGSQPDFIANEAFRHALVPPSTVRFAPVMYAASGLATNETNAATSSTEP